MLILMENFSIYLHIPFCVHRCSYCDFNTTAGQQAFIPEYVNALRQEIRWTEANIPVHTIYFGGGTPSLLSPDQFETILLDISNHFQVSRDAEVTLEANPGTVTQNQLNALRQIGFNRISFGMQSAIPEELCLLQRKHNTYDVIRAVDWARRAGFKQLSLDLIYGVPGQSLKNWQQSLEMALKLRPDHLSLYSLQVEEGTPLFRWTARGLVSIPDDDIAADQYEWAMQRLEEAGFEQYEISNWARRDERGLNVSRHNLQYWLNQPYLGLGAAAHGYAGGYRVANVPSLMDYLKLMNEGGPQPFPFGCANETRIKIDPEDEIQETMMVGLRLTELGVSRKAFHERFQFDMEELYGNVIKRLIHAGLLEWGGQDADQLRLTRRGRLLGNRVFMEFVGKYRC